MKPIKFNEANVELQKPRGLTDEQCLPLPTYTDGEQCISCWKPTWKERLSILLFGKCWAFVLSGKTQPPIKLMGARTVFEEAKDE